MHVVAWAYCTAYRYIGEYIEALTMPYRMKMKSSLHEDPQKMEQNETLRLTTQEVEPEKVKRTPSLQGLNDLKVEYNTRKFAWNPARASPERFVAFLSRFI